MNFSKENLFDRWTEKYDGDVFESDHNNEYPLPATAKYFHLLGRVNPKNDAKILDLE